MSDLKPTRLSVNLDGSGSFSYLVWGEGGDKPLLVFAHATGFNALTYRHLLAPLAERFRVVAVDLRGHGMSSAKADPERLNGWETYRDDMVAFLDYMGETAFMAGHSMGGTISILAAAERPKLVRGLVLAEPVMRPPRQEILMAISRALGRTKRSPLVVGAAKRRPIFSDRRTMFASYKGRGAFASWSDDMLRDYIEGGTNKRADGSVSLTCAPAWEARTFAMAVPRIWGGLGELTQPITLLYAGGPGSTFDEGTADHFRRQRPEDRILHVEKASHFLPMEQPELVRDEIVAMAENLGSLPEAVTETSY